MRIERAANIPIITHDPYLSIWSASENLYDKDLQHWSELRQQMRGYLNIGDEVYCFMGNPEFHAVIPQVYVDVTANSTEYCFENAKAKLTVRFTSPLLLDAPEILSRPCTYVDVKLENKTESAASVNLVLSSDLVSRNAGEDLIGGSYSRAKKENQEAFSYAVMGRAKQQPLGESGDNVTINWGYLYVAGQKQAVLSYDKDNKQLCAKLSFDAENTENNLIIAFDDLVSINYFGEFRRGYWTKTCPTIQDAIGTAFAQREEIEAHAARLDADLEKRAREVGGEAYVFLANLSYRHAISAHKLIENEKGEIMFFSKENDSNGCIGTVDVSYPSVPLFLLYNTEYVKGMLRPVFDFASRDVWEFDFAPHDVGRYPYAWGQVYGMNGKKERIEFTGEQDRVFPPLYQYPTGTDLYEFKYQMPVEECGNMLIMTAAVCVLDKSIAFAKPHLDVLKQWTRYLTEYGNDPGEQLCTDDFAGHLAHNVNLSAKAVMGVEAYAQLMKLAGEEAQAKEWHEKAKEMAASWQDRAFSGDHYRLSFDKPESWSLKYNLVWDLFFESNLFDKSVYETETKWYLKKSNQYGIPLDSRQSYTKSDWILWCAAMAPSKEEAEQIIAPVAAYLKETPSRVPFSDWYETISGASCHFKGRSVQGGIYMPILIQEKK